MGDGFSLTAIAAGMHCEQGCYGSIKNRRLIDGLTIILGPAKHYRGRVLSPNGAPVVGAKVQASSGGQKSDQDGTDIDAVFKGHGYSAHAITKEDGSFRLGPTNASGVSANVQAEGFPKWQGRFASPDKEHEVVLEAGEAVAGVVTTKAGVPVINAQVQLRSGMTIPKTKTDAQGRFRFDGLNRNDGAYLRIFHPDHALHLECRCFSKLEGGLKIVLSPPLAIFGRVVDMNGNGVRGVNVWIEGDRLADVGYVTGHVLTWERLSDKFETHTDEDGGFSFPNLYAGQFAVRAKHPMNGDLQCKLQVESGTRGVLLELDEQAMRGVVLKGKVLDAVTQEPIRRFNVAPYLQTDWGSQASARSFADDQGRYEFIGLPEAEIRLKITAEGYATWSAEKRLYKQGDHEVPAMLFKERMVELRVVDPQGLPASNAQLSFVGVNGQRATFNKGPFKGYESVNTDQNGCVTVSGLPATMLTVNIAVQGHKEPFRHVISLVEEPLGEIELIAGQVKRPEMSGLMVILLQPTEGTTADAVASLQGFSLDKLGALMRDMMEGKETRFRWLSTEAQVSIEEEGGRVLGKGACKPKEDGTFASNWGGYSRSKPPFAMVAPQFPVSKTAVLVVKAEGCKAVRRTLDTTKLKPKQQHVEIVVLQPQK